MYMKSQGPRAAAAITQTTQTLRTGRAVEIRMTTPDTNDTVHTTDAVRDTATMTTVATTVPTTVAEAVDPTTTTAADPREATAPTTVPTTILRMAMRVKLHTATDMDTDAVSVFQK